MHIAHHKLFVLAFEAGWGITAVVWFAGALVSKPAERTHPFTARVFYILALLGIFVLLFRTNIPRIAILTQPILPNTTIVTALGLLLTLAGLAFAIWARFHLGGNWSGRITIKKDHTLVLSGPYRIVRHPIYTGLICALLGTVIAIGEVRSLIAFALALLLLKHKANIEEHFMTERFGDAYIQYRRHVKSLLPYLW